MIRGDNPTINVGIAADVDGFFNKLRKEFKDFTQKGADLGLADSFQKEIDEISRMFDSLQKTMKTVSATKLNSTTFSKFQKNIGGQIEALEKRTTALESGMETLVKTMSKADGGKFKSMMDEIKQSMSETLNTAEQLTDAIGTVVKSGSKNVNINIVTKQQVDDLKEIKQTLKDINSIQGSKSSKTVDSMRKDIEKLSQSYVDLKKQMNSVPQNSKEFDDLQRELAETMLALKTYEANIYETFSDADMDKILNKSIKNLGKAPQAILDEIDKTSSRMISSLQSRINEMNKIVGEAVEEVHGKDDKIKGYSIPVSIKTSPENLAKQVTQLIEKVRPLLADENIEVGISLVTDWGNRKQRELFKEFQTKVGSIIDTSDSAEIKAIYDDITKYFNDEIQIKIRSDIDKERQHIIDQINKIREEIKKEPLSLDISQEKGQKNKQIFDRSVLNGLETLAEKLKEVQSISNLTRKDLVKIQDVLSKMRFPGVSESVEALDNSFAKMQKQLQGLKGSLRGSNLDEIKSVLKAYKEYQVQGGKRGFEELSGQKNIQNWFKKHINDEIELDGSKFQQAGKQLGEDYAAGIRQGIAEVVKACEEMIEAALEAIRSTQNSHSKAKEPEKLENDFMDGVLYPLKSRLPEVQKAGEKIGETISESIANGFSKEGQGFADKFPGQLTNALIQYSRDGKIENLNSSSFGSIFSSIDFIKNGKANFRKLDSTEAPGAKNSGIFANEKYVLALRNLESETEDLIPLIHTAREEGAHIPRILGYIKDGLTTLELMERAPGENVASLIQKGEFIPSEKAIYGLMDDIDILLKNGIRIDIIGDNFLYDKVNDQFWIVDPAKSSKKNRSLSGFQDDAHGITKKYFADKKLLPQYRSIIDSWNKTSVSSENIEKETTKVEEHTEAIKKDTAAQEENQQVRKKEPKQQKQYQSETRAIKEFEKAFNKYFDLYQQYLLLAEKNPNKAAGVAGQIRSLTQKFPTLKDIGGQNKQDIDYEKELNKFLSTQTALQKKKTSATKESTKAKKEETQAQNELNKVEKQSGDTTSKTKKKAQAAKEEKVQVEATTKAKQEQTKKQEVTDEKAINSSKSKVKQYATEKNAIEGFTKAYNKLFEIQDKRSKATTDAEKKRSTSQKAKLLEQFPTLKGIGRKKKENVDFDAQLKDFLATQEKLNKAQDVKGTVESAKNIKKEADALDVVENSAKSASKSKEAFSEANKEVLQSIASSLNGLNNEGKAFENLNKLINNLGGKNGDTKLKATIDGLKEIVKVLSYPLDGNSFIDALEKIASSGSNLGDIATILKASNKNLLEAVDTLNKASGIDLDDILNTKSQEILNNAKMKLLELGGKDSQLINVSNITKTKDGFLEIVGVIKTADDQLQEFTLHTKDGIEMQNVGMSENTARLAKQMKMYAQVEQFFNKMKEQGKMIADGAFFNPDIDPETWKMLLGFAEEYKDYLGEIRSITMQTRQDKAGGTLLESFSINGSNGNHLTVGPTGNIVASAQDILGTEQTIKKIQELIQERKKYNELAQKRVEGIASEQDLADLTRYEDKLEEVTGSVKHLNDVFGSNEASEYLDKLQASLTSDFNNTITKFAESASNKINNALTSKSNQYTSFVSEFQIEIDKAVENIDTLNKKIRNHPADTPWSDDERAAIKEMTAQIDSVTSGIKDLENVYQDLGSVDKLIGKISKDLNDNTAMSGNLKSRFTELRDQIKALRGDSNGTEDSISQIDKVTFKRLTAEFNRLHAEMLETKQTGDSFFTSLMKAAQSRTVQFLARYLSFYDFIRYGRQAYETIKQLDTALVDLKKTTTMSNSELQEFYINSSNIAKQMGTSTEQIISQAAAWSRLGYSSKEAATEMAALSSQFAAISPGMSLDDATDNLVSTMKAFHIAVNNVESDIMDPINRLGNTMATSNSEIGEMLKRSSAAMAAANNSLAETAALESAAVQITRNAETTGMYSAA